jgi:hypothetical protein
MIALGLNPILEYLRENNFDAQLQKQTNQVYIPFKVADKEYPVFLRIFEGGELLQILAFMPCNIKSDALNDTARLLHLLNKELDIPGFGLDETAMVVFYRCMIPGKDQQVDESLFDAYLNSLQTICQIFGPIIAAVAFGSMTYQEVLKKSQDSSKTTPKTKPRSKSH